MVSVKEQKKIDGIKSSMHFLTDKGMGKHTVFVDSAKEVEDFSAAEYFDTPEELTGARERAFPRMVYASTSFFQCPHCCFPPVLFTIAHMILITYIVFCRCCNGTRHASDRAYNRVRKETLEKGLVADGTELGKGVKKKLAKAKEKAYVEMYDRQERLKKVERLRLHLQAQKNLLVRVESFLRRATHQRQIYVNELTNVTVGVLFVAVSVCAQAKGRRVLEEPAKYGKPAVHRWKSERKK